MFLRNSKFKRLIQGALVVVCLVFSACGKNKSEPEFVPYIEAFYKAAEDRGIHVRNDDLFVHFGETMPGATAQCVLSNARPGLGGTEIIVNREGWTSYTDSYFEPEKEILMFHELGHCLLGRGHQEKTINLCDRTDAKKPRWYANIPLSLMKQSNYIEPSLYLKLRTYFLDQLFLLKTKSITAEIRKSESPDTCRAKRQDSDES